MAGLGMQINKNGEFESFPQYLARTENIISFMANIQSSLPSSNGLLGGNNGAVRWLQRYLDLLPPSATGPLPLITAPVLCAFLIGAGHMLANKHADTFKTLLDTIVSNVLNRLDEGEFGKPSAIRLKKILEGRFEHFRSNLPIKAIPELYFGASGESKKHSDDSYFGGTIGAADNEGRYHDLGQRPAPNPFGWSSGASPSISTSSFGATSTVSLSSENPFGSSSDKSSAFGTSGSLPSPSPFASSSVAPVHSPFGSVGNSMQQASQFGTFSDANTAFGTAQSNPSSFGRSHNSLVSNSPFGANSSASRHGGSSNVIANPFGGTSKASESPSPFSNNVISMSPFGVESGNDNSAASNTTFGVTGASTQASFPLQNSSPFGGGASTTTFGSSATSNPSPFGTSAPSPSPFTKQLTTPFGVPGSSTQPFGLSTNSSPSPFGGAQTAASPSPFSTQNQKSPFGGNASFFPTSGGANPSPFGGTQFASSPSPFSSQAMSPFAATTQQSFGLGSNLNKTSSFASSTAFGGGNQQHQDFGGAGGKRTQPLCKFYAKGQCKYGANCRFSHDFAASSNGSGFGSGNSGGFSGVVGGFGTNTPFGGPRR
jgi:hypothetical protein